VQKSDGMNYAPTGKARPVCGPGEFRSPPSASTTPHLRHVQRPRRGGRRVAWVFDPDPQRVAAFCAAYDGVKVARSEAAVLEDPTIRLIASATVPCRRGPLGLRAMAHDKDYSPTTPLTSLDQLDAARAKAPRPAVSTRLLCERCTSRPRSRRAI